MRGDRGRPGPGSVRPAAARSAAPAAVAAPAAPAQDAPAERIQLVAATDDTAVATADDAVDSLLDEGRAPGDVLVLTTGEPHPWAQHELSFGEDAYWRQESEGEDVFCATASAASAVSRLTARAVVVLAVNGGSDTVVAQALPAALAKAAERLVVCGDPQRLRALL
ncbi:hypothetical protein V1J52_00275 [Streptomyces sp. TRM 70351]|uniref:hypothetical protein n=1 Tax=Streptomyces sp. TRM 70351 TaxID=3116552 RepID=UPI002E7B07BD|nr:hypothetical protein [Streptomyces sp. TRM 70351]MEE1926631.1 hypothetical protein [Streptomyces sp. TRM 70351]